MMGFCFVGVASVVLSVGLCWYAKLLSDRKTYKALKADVSPEYFEWALTKIGMSKRRRRMLGL